MSLSEKLTNIKSNLTSLLSFANEQTGRSDTDLGEALRALADGFGQGGDGEEYFMSDVNGTTNGGGIFYPKHYVRKNESIKSMTACQKTGWEFLESIIDESTNIDQYSVCWNCKNLKSAKLPYINKLNQYMVRQQNITSLIESLEYGSIGHPITSINGQNWNYGNNRKGCTITIYTTATSLADVQSSITSGTWLASNTSNCTMIYRNSETGEILS